MNSRFALLALSIAIAVLSLALVINVVGVTASSVSGEAFGIEANTVMESNIGNHPLVYQGLNINQDEPLSLTEPISIYLPLVSTVGYIDKSLERAALIALYNSTNGDGWRDNTGWSTDAPHCEWYGVTCDVNEHVEILDLDGNRLTGTLPSEIGNLPMLTALRLNGTSECWWIPIAAPPPPCYWEYYQLSDPLPPEISNLVNLQELNLGGNQLTSLPQEIGNLVNLQRLYLYDNQLTTLPAEIGNLAHLQELNLFDNQLTYLPSEIGNLANLQWLYLSDNQLSDPIPAFLSNLSNLYSLYLDNNPDLTCWETAESRNWAYELDFYVGPTYSCIP